MLNAGRMRDRITFQKRSTTKDAYGHTSGEFEDSARTNIPADVQDLEGSELFKSQMISAEANIRIQVRGFNGWRSEITPDLRVRFGDRYFDIKAVTNPDSRGRFLNIIAKEIVR